MADGFGVRGLAQSFGVRGFAHGLRTQAVDGRRRDKSVGLKGGEGGKGVPEEEAMVV